MKNLRKNQEEKIEDYEWCKAGEHNAVVRTFGKKWKVFWYGDILPEPPVSLKDCSVKYIKVHNDIVYDIFDKFTFDDLTFSVSVGEWHNINPLGIAIATRDIDRAYRLHRDAKNK